MRENLKLARKRIGLTQQQMADKLGIEPRYYKAIESGERLGGIWIWDALEDITGVPQRILRDTRPIGQDDDLVITTGTIHLDELTKKQKTRSGRREPDGGEK